MDRSNLPDPLPFEYDEASPVRSLTRAGQDLGAAVWQVHLEAEQGRVHLAGLLVLTAMALLLPQASVIPILFAATVAVGVQVGRRRAAYRCVGSPTPASHQRAELWSIAAGSTFLVCGPLLAVFVLLPIFAPQA